MIYRAPENVISPIDYVTNVRVIYDGGVDDVSIAKLNWGGHEVFGMRWNISQREWEDERKITEEEECLGMPVSRGYPVWFIVPEEFFDRDSNLWDKLKKGLEALD